MSCNNCNNCSSCGCETEGVQEVQQFVPYKEYAVGEFFKHGKGIYKVVNGSSDYDCPKCDLRLCSSYIKCTRYERSDYINIEAILYDSEE